MLVWLVVAVVRLFIVGFASGNCVVCVYIFRTDDTLDFGLFALGPFVPPCPSAGERL